MKTPENPLSDWLDNQDIMQALHLSERTLQTWRKSGKIPFSKIGGKIYYKKEDLQQLLINNYSKK